MRFIVSGKVQGVGFRAGARREARRDGVRGWARNLPDGRVEVIASADALGIRAFSDWVGHGPRYAQVDDVTRDTLDVPELPQDFWIL